MELVAILRILWARRVIVGVGIIVAAAAGLLAGHKAQTRAAGGSAPLSTLALMLDTKRSQLVAAAPEDAWSLPSRAWLLADAVGRDSVTAMLAREAGVPVEQLAVIGPSAIKIPNVDSPLVSQAYRAAATPEAPYVVSVRVDGMTPLIRVEASAPDKAAAARLAQAGEAVLDDLLVRYDTHRSRGFVLDTVTPLRTKRLPAESAHAGMMMAAAALFTFMLWCATVVLATGIARRPRVHLRAPRPS